MSNHRISYLTLAFVGLLVGCGGGGGEPAGAAPGIVFTSRRATGYPNIWAMGPGGAAQHALTSVAFEEAAPTLDPTGEWVAFLTKRYGVKNQLALVEVGTGTVTQVLPDTFSQSEPTWSPDGAWIAFARGGTLYKVHPEGDGLAVLKVVAASSPTWDPAGHRIAYATAGELHVLDLDTGADTAIVTGIGSLGRTQWSPDGTRIAYLSASVVWLVAPDGSGNVSVASGGHAWAGMGWSEDGTWLYGSTNIDVSGTAPNYEIFRFRPAGTDHQRLTTNGDNSGGPVDDWPSGGLLAP